MLNILDLKMLISKNKVSHFPNLAIIGWLMSGTIYFFVAKNATEVIK
jgi:hypothetical protein